MPPVGRVSPASMVTSWINPSIWTPTTGRSSWCWRGRWSWCWRWYWWGWRWRRCWCGRRGRWSVKASGYAVCSHPRIPYAAIAFFHPFIATCSVSASLFAISFHPACPFPFAVTLFCVPPAFGIGIFCRASIWAVCSHPVCPLPAAITSFIIFVAIITVALNKSVGSRHIVVSHSITFGFLIIFIFLQHRSRLQKRQTIIVFSLAPAHQRREYEDDWHDQFTRRFYT